MKTKWYNKAWTVYLIIIVIPPLGLYALYKNELFGKTKKYILYGICFLLTISFIDRFYENSSEKYYVGNNESNKESDLEIIQKNDNRQYGFVIVHVVVRNNSDELKDYVQIDASFFDKNGKILGTGIGNTTNFPAKSERTIDVIASDINNYATYKLDLKDGF